MPRGFLKQVTDMLRQVKQKGHRSVEEHVRCRKVPGSILGNLQFKKSYAAGMGRPLPETLMT